VTAHRRGLIGAVKTWVTRRLSPSRLEHVQAVARTAVRLARRHGVDPGKAELAAWLHDAAKEMTPARMTRLLEGTPFRWDRWERRIPELRHAQASAALAWKVFGVRDRAILSAVRHHPMGRPRMGRLETLLFVADYVEPGRAFRGADRARRAAAARLEEGALAKAEGVHEHLRRAGGPLHPRLRRTADWLRHAVARRRKGIR
jgi:predicted HD superfamily hydrolase involved in NAD metabolism